MVCLLCSPFSASGLLLCFIYALPGVMWVFGLFPVGSKSSGYAKAGQALNHLIYKVLQPNLYRCNYAGVQQYLYLNCVGLSRGAFGSFKLTHKTQPSECRR